MRCALPYHLVRRCRSRFRSPTLRLVNTVHTTRDIALPCSMKLDHAASIHVDMQTEGAPLLVSEGEGTQSVINLNLVSSSLKVLKLIRHPDGRFKKCKARFVARRFCPRDKLLFGLYDHQSFESTFVSPDQSSTWPRIQHDKLCLRAEMSAPIPSDIAGFIRAHLQKKHERVLMTHSGPFDRNLAKLFRAQGLQQSMHDPCLFFSDKVVAVLFDTGTLFWAPVANDIHDLLVRLREEGLILHVDDIYANPISTKPIPQVQDTDGLSPEEGASVFGTCVIVTSPSSTAKQSHLSMSLFRSGDFQYAWGQRFLYGRGIDQKVIVLHKCDECGKDQNWSQGNNYNVKHKLGEYFCPDAPSLFSAS